MAVMLTALLSFSFSTTPHPAPKHTVCDAEGPWTMVYKHNDIIVYYDIMDCLDDHYWLFMKVVNNTGKQKKMKFTAQVMNEDNSIETFNFIKVIEPYSSEKAECGKESIATGLVRPLKVGNKASSVVVSFEKESPLVAN